MSSGARPYLSRVERGAGHVLSRLPDRLVRILAGKPHIIDGRTLEPRIQIAATAAKRKPPVSSRSIGSARSEANQSLADGNGPRASGVRVEDQETPDGLPIRVYRASAVRKPQVAAQPGMLFMHQGGFVLGDLDTCDTFCSRIAANVDMVVFSLDYRLAPEHPYPSQRDDADEAWAWLQTAAADFGVDPTRIVVAGDSAGGHLSATLCQRLRDSNREVPLAQLLVYPFVDATAEGGSMDSCAESFPLDQATIDWFAEQWKPDQFDPESADASPILGDLHDLPPAIIVTAGFDPLRDQGIAYGEALREAGCAVIDRCEDALSHAFLSMGGVVPLAEQAQTRIIADLVRVIGRITETASADSGATSEVVKLDGRFELRRDGEVVSIADFTESNGVVTIPHVGTNPAYRGRGNAGRLMDGLLTQLRNDGLKIVPLCPFAAAHIADNLHWQDLLEVSRRSPR